MSVRRAGLTGTGISRSFTLAVRTVEDRCRAVARRRSLTVAVRIVEEATHA